MRRSTVLNLPLSVILPWLGYQDSAERLDKAGNDCPSQTHYLSAVETKSFVR